MAISKKYGIAAMQWADSKVVNCVSSYLNFSERTIQRQIGRNKESFPCPATLVHYQENMGGVDRIDQMRSHFGGLASVSHFKKWYKKALMAVIDCMLLNGLHLWNAVAEKLPDRVKLKRHRYLRVISDFLLTYETPTFMSPVKNTKKTRFESPIVIERTEEEQAVDDGKQMGAAKKMDRCLVCSLESSQYQKLWSLQKQDDKDNNRPTNFEMRARVKTGVAGVRRAVAYCLVCDVKAHSTVFDQHSTKLIHGFFPATYSCMDILHSPLGKSIWSIQRDTTGRCVARVKIGHHVLKDLYSLIATDMGVSPTIAQKGNPQLTKQKRSSK